MKPMSLKCRGRARVGYGFLGTSVRNTVWRGGHEVDDEEQGGARWARGERTYLNGNDDPMDYGALGLSFWIMAHCGLVFFK